MKQGARKKTINATELRQKLFRYLDEVQKEGGPVIVEKNGKPQAVILNFEEYKKALEKKLIAGPSLSLVDELRVFHQDYLKTHHGKMSSDSVKIIRQLREEN